MRPVGPQDAPGQRSADIIGQYRAGAHCIDPGTRDGCGIEGNGVAGGENVFPPDGAQHRIHAQEPLGVGCQTGF